MDDNWEPGTPKDIWVQHFVEYGNFFEYKKFLIQKMSWSKNVGPSIFLGHEKFGLDVSLGCQSFKT